MQPGTKERLDFQISERTETPAHAVVILIAPGILIASPASVRIPSWLVTFSYCHGPFFVT